MIKLHKILIKVAFAFFLSLIALFFLYLVSFLKLEYKLILLLLFVIMMSVIITLLVVSIVMSLYISKSTNKIKTILQLKISSIYNDGNYFELMQSRSIFEIIKNRRDNIILTEIALGRLFKSDLLSIKDWLKRNERVDLYIVTHDSIIKSVHRYFDDEFEIQKIKDVKRCNRFIWAYTSLLIRGRLMKRPDRFAKYKVTLKKV